MSAWICSDEHISAIVSHYFLSKYGNYYHVDNTPENRAAMANLLKKENYRSVNYRYNERSRAKTISTVDEYPPVDVSLVDAYKLAHSLEYQSCERHDYYSSKAYRVLRDIQAELSYTIIYKNVPEYTEAKWTYK